MMIRNQIKEMKITCSISNKELAVLEVKMVNSRRYGFVISERDYELKLQELCKKGIISIWILHDDRIPIGKDSTILCPEVNAKLFEEFKESKLSVADFYFENINPMVRAYIK